MDALNGVIKRILKSNPKLKLGLDEARILELWAPAVGPQIAKYSRAVQLRDKTLMISVEHPIWKQELLANKRLVLQKFNSTLNLELGEQKDQTPWVEELFIVNPSKVVKTYPRK